MWKKIIMGFMLLAVALFILLSWYKFHFSMAPARAFDVNSTDSSRLVLIATQGSEFKKAVVSGVVDHLRQERVYIKVIDVSALPQFDPQEWSAILVIHTWENWKPQADARAFLDRVKDKRKILVFTTSGAGNIKIKGFNAISSASVMADVPARVKEITNRLDTILQPDTPVESTSE